ncbi:MAG: aldehyde dehydrogenase family protein [Burkholderiaceae bacterium]|nr:aldehyde dehydrogenase family protein [Burkholderiaceae bacterium]
MQNGIFINGQWLNHGPEVPNINPSDTDDVLGSYNWGSVSDIDAAADAARAAEGAWAEVLPEARAHILRRAGDELIARSEELGRVLSREQGKTLREGRAEVIRSGEIFHYYAGETVRNHGFFTPGLRSGFTISVSREPVGLIGVITPWNLPLAIPVWKIAPALAYGNTVIYKPSELTPACAWVLVDILERAGVPPGVLNMVMGNGRELGQALIDRSDAISFTGSGPTGSIIVEAAARQMKKVQAELGGKSGLIIDNDCNIELAVEVAFQGAYHGTGQRCTASTRIIALDSVRDEFLERLVQRMASSKVGHALDATTEIGPVVDDRQLLKNLEYIDIARNEGAELLFGGQRVERSHPGYYFEPGLFINTTNQMRINQEEVFGPVASVLAAHDMDEAIAIANDVHFALSSGIMTNNLINAENFRRRSKAAMVTINATTAGLDFHVPFGGRSPSGYGAREQGMAAQEFFTEYKSCYTNVSGRL